MQKLSPDTNLQTPKPKLDYMTVGLSSKIGKKGKSHIVMLDIDDFHTLESVIDIAKSLIGEYLLSDGYIFQSSNNLDGRSHWHLIFLDRLIFSDAFAVIEPYVDGNWLKMSKQRKEFVLRCSPRISYKGNRIEKRDEIDFITIVVSPYHNTHIKSNAHRLALERIYDIHIDRKGHFDGSTKTKMVAYAMSSEPKVVPNA